MLSWLGYNMIHRGLLLRAHEIKIQGESKREDVQETCTSGRHLKASGMQTYVELMGTAENGMVERHDHTTLALVFRLNNLLMMMI